MEIFQHSFYTLAGLIPNVNKVNQDRYIISTNLECKNNKINLFGVADGHGQFGH